MLCAARQLHIDLSKLDNIDQTLLPWLDERLRQNQEIKRVNISASSLQSTLLIRFAHACRERGLQTFLCSNASILQNVDLKILAQTPLNLLGFWLESLIPETQESLRPGERLADILRCFEAFKSNESETTCALYTHLLEQNQDEILRILEYVKLQRRVDKLMLHMLGTQTPARINSFRDLQKKFSGKPMIEDAFFLFDRLSRLALKESSLINHYTQVLFWKSTLEVHKQDSKKPLTARKRLKGLRKLLKEVPCFQHEPVEYFIEGSSVFHCELKNPQNLSFSDPLFQSVTKEISGCDLDCHFKINKAHLTEKSPEDQLPIQKLIAYQYR